MSFPRLLLSLAAVLSVGATLGAPVAHATSVAVLAASPSVRPAPGRVSGVVTDSTSGETLIGATIRVAGTSIGTATDIDGRFSIAGVPSGPQTLTVSYIGYDDKTVQVVVPDGGSLTVDVVLAYSVADALGEVTVTAQTQGQLAAINQQLNSNTISNIVSSDRIRELPDNNAAESIGRLPGVALERSAGEASKVIIRGLAPKYSTVLVNGVRVPSTDSQDRSVDLTTISPESLAGIEVFKAIPADFEADAIGGTVNLRLRTAPTGFHGYGSAQTGYNDVQNQFGNYRLYGSVSNRFMGNKLGLIVGGNLEDVDRSADRFNGSYDVVENTTGGVFDSTFTIRPNNLRVSEDREARRRIGGSLVADYRYGTGTVSFNTFLSRRSSDITIRQDFLNIGGVNQQYVVGRNPENTVDLGTGALNVLQRLGPLQLDATASFARSVNRSPNNRQWTFNQGNAFQSGVDLSSPNLTLDSLQGLANNTLESTYLVNASIFDQRSREDEGTLRADLTYPISFGSFLAGSVKVGAMARNRDRTFNRDQQADNLFLGGGQGYRKIIGEALPELFPGQGPGGPGTIRLQPFLDPNYNPGSFLEGQYSLGYTAQVDLLNRLTDAIADTLRFDAQNSFARDYNGTERYRAGYAMAELKLGRYVTFVPGLRYERMNTEYTGYFIKDSGGYTTAEDFADADSTVARKNDYFFPQLLLTVRPTGWLNLRAARTRTLTRPDYNQITPRRFVDITGLFVSQSNPFIEPAVSANYDVAASLHEDHIGLFSVGYFRKSVKGFIQGLDTYLINDCKIQGFTPPCAAQIPGARENARINLPVNNPFDADINGIEVDLQTSFWYLPSYLRGIVLNVNYTHINTSTRYPFTVFKQDFIFEPEFQVIATVRDTSRAGQLGSQPNDILNLSAGYDLKGFSSRLSFQYIARTLSGVNVSQAANSTFNNNRLRVDFSGRQKVTDNFEIYLNLNNLTSLPEKSYLGNSLLRPTFAEYYGLTGDLGLRYRF